MFKYIVMIAMVLFTTNAYSQVSIPGLNLELRGGAGTSSTLGGSVSYDFTSSPAYVEPSGHGGSLGIGVDRVAGGAGELDIVCSKHHHHRECSLSAREREDKTLYQIEGEYIYHTPYKIDPFVTLGVGGLDDTWAVSSTTGVRLRVRKWLSTGIAYRVIGAGEDNDTNHGAIFNIRLELF